MVMTTFPETDLQVPFPVVVAVNVTIPFCLSAAEGVYSGLIKSAFENVPVPLVDQCRPEAMVTLPCRAMEGASAQMICSVPGFTVGAGVMNRFTVSFTGLQFPLPSEVSTSIICGNFLSSVEGK